MGIKVSKRYSKEEKLTKTAMLHDWPKLHITQCDWLKDTIWLELV